LNHGLFKWFKLVTNTLEKDWVNCLSANNILDENVYKWLVNRLSFYQKEKDENFYKLIDDINDIEINFGSRYIRWTSINQHLWNGWTITNIQDVVTLAKSYFIQRIKSWETVNMDIETYKNQLAYMLATIQIESRYQYNAYNNKWKYGWYGQIANYHKNLWIFLIQWSWINLWPWDSEPTVEKLKKIWTKKLLTDHNFSTFWFVYWMTYWHLSNGGNLDKYINDENVNNPNYLWARRIEGWGNAKAFVWLAKDWKKIIDDSIKSD
jgi:hypothetical protein